MMPLNDGYETNHRLSPANLHRLVSLLNDTDSLKTPGAVDNRLIRDGSRLAITFSEGDETTKIAFKGEQTVQSYTELNRFLYSIIRTEEYRVQLQFSPVEHQRAQLLGLTQELEGALGDQSKVHPQVAAMHDYGRLLPSLNELQVRAKEIPQLRAELDETIDLIQKIIVVREQQADETEGVKPEKTIRRTLPTDADARQNFLEIERIARLPKDEQAKQLSRLYHELAPPYMNEFVEGLLSSVHRNILDRETGFFDGNTTMWAEQLANAAEDMSPKEVADKIEHGLWLNIASRARTLQVFLLHADAIFGLIQDDLNSGKNIPLERATAKREHTSTGAWNAEKESIALPPHRRQGDAWYG